MARVDSLTTDGINALFAAKTADDATKWGTKADVAANTANISAQGLTIATNTSDITTAKANIAAAQADIITNQAYSAANRPTVCTSTTRPTTNLYVGKEIRETDTGRKYEWNGSAWQILFAPDRCRVARTTDQTATSASQINFLFDTGNATEELNVNGLHSLTTNPTRITIKVPGLYQIITSVKWSPNTNGLRQVTNYKNGGATLNAYVDSRISPAAAGWETGQVLVDMAYLVAGDFIEGSGYQGSGGTLTMRGMMDVSWIRPTSL
jgi:hypothetical protein